MKIKFLCLLVTLPLSVSAQDSKPLTVSKGTEFTVTLASNPTTGYSWALAKPLDAKFLTLVTNVYVRPDSRLMGAGGKELWTFKAVATGTAQVDLKYVRPWETNVAPVRTTNFVVVVNPP